MEYSPVFLKLRAIAFFIICSASFISVILLCFAIFFRWDVTDSSERPYLVALLLVNTMDVVMFPILMLRVFRPWVDAAGIGFLFTVHVGVAVVYTVYLPQFACLDESDHGRACEVINISILVDAWMNPTLFLSYMGGLALMMYYRSKLLANENDLEAKMSDGDSNGHFTEMQSSYHHSVLSDIHKHGRESWRASFVEWMNSTPGIVAY